MILGQWVDGSRHGLKNSMLLNPYDVGDVRVTPAVLRVL